MAKRIVIACGGTGGHLFPGLAVGEELRARGHEVLLILSNKPVDAAAMQSSPGWEFEKLPVMGWVGLTSPKTPLFFVRLLQSIFKCKKIFKKWKPDCVLGMGGFSSFVPLMKSVRGKVPGLLHESNVIPGKVTRILAKELDRVLLGLDACAQRLPKGARTRWTGTPLRSSIQAVPREEALAKFGFESHRKTVLIMGGSQGARGINDAMIRAMPLLEDKKDTWQFLHLTGPDDVSLVEFNYRREHMLAKVLGFCSEMGAAYAAADVCVTRSGAASISELMALRVPAIFVPFPNSAEDHQLHNARVVEAAGAASLIEQKNLTPDLLASVLNKMLQDDATLNKMREACSALSTLDAARRVADAVEEEMS